MAAEGHRGVAARLLGKLRPGLAKPQARQLEELDWVVGGRYELLREVSLCGPGPESESVVGRLPSRRSVLLLAIYRSSAAGAGDRTSLLGEVVLGFLADTSRQDWTCGWAQISGPPAGTAGGPVALRQRCKGSWEVGGRYRALGKLALREDIELDSDEVAETRNGEEALMLDLGLHMVPSSRGGSSSSSAHPDGAAHEPRLRARVRMDSGKVGWLTVELPGGSPLLDPINLYSLEALQWRSALFKTRNGRSRVSVRQRQLQASAGGALKETWEVGGQYRTLAPLVLRQESEVDSQVLGSVKVGELITVHEIAEVSLPASGQTEFRLRISSTEGGSPSVLGWVSCARKSGEVLIDVRDHLEFVLVTGDEPPPPVGSHLTMPAPEPEEEQSQAPPGLAQQVASLQEQVDQLCMERQAREQEAGSPDAAAEGPKASECLACGGHGCGMCGGRLPSAASPEAAGAASCLACGGHGCGLCGGQRPSASSQADEAQALLTDQAPGDPHAMSFEEKKSLFEETSPATVQPETPASVPTEVGGAGAETVERGEAVSPPVRSWQTADGLLPVEAVGDQRSRSPRPDSRPDSPPRGAEPLVHVSAHHEPAEYRSSKVDFNPTRSSEYDEWRPFDDLRVEMEAPGDGCAECHGDGGSFFSWGGALLSCGGSRLARPSKSGACGWSRGASSRPDAGVQRPTQQLGEPMPEPTARADANPQGSQLRDWLLV